VSESRKKKGGRRRRRAVERIEGERGGGLGGVTPQGQVSSCFGGPPSLKALK